MFIHPMADCQKCPRTEKGVDKRHRELQEDSNKTQSPKLNPGSFLNWSMAGKNVYGSSAQQY